MAVFALLETCPATLEPVGLIEGQVNEALNGFTLKRWGGEKT